MTQVRINQANMARFLGPAGQPARQVADYTRRSANAARAGAPVDTGKGRASIRDDLAVHNGKIIGRIFMDWHMWFQHEGTGVYAGNGPITPKNGKYLVFPASRGIGPLPKGRKHSSRGGRPLVFAKKVKGVPPNPFLLNAIRANCPWPVRHRNR